MFAYGPFVMVGWFGRLGAHLYMDGVCIQRFLSEKQVLSETALANLL